MRELTKGLTSHFRWGKDKYGAKYEESILEHTFKMMVLTAIMLFLEKGEDAYEDLGIFLLCALTHDWAEARMGDIVLPEKSPLHQSTENRIYLEIVKEMIPPEICHHFPLPFDQRKEATAEQREFWMICEHIGYLVYAYEQVNRGDDPRGGEPQKEGYLDIVKKQQRFLKPYEDKYKSVRIFLKALKI